MDVILAWVYRKSVPYSFLWPMAAAGIFGVFVAALVLRYVDTTYCQRRTKTAPVAGATVHHLADFGRSKSAPFFGM